MAKKITTTIIEEIDDNYTPTAKKPLLVKAVIDMSGSMMNVWGSTIAGYNEYVDGQKVLPSTEFSLSVFDDIVELRYGPTKVNDVIPLNTETYKPRHGTALRDAVAQTITEVSYIANQYEKILFYIITDGEENSSTKYSSQQLKALIREKESAGWEFVFMGANVDAWNQSENLGFTGGNRYTYTADNKTTTGIFRAMSASTAAYASTPGMSRAVFTANTASNLYNTVGASVSSPTIDNLINPSIDKDTDLE